MHCPPPCWTCLCWSLVLAEASATNALEDVHKVPQKSISWRCLSQDGDVFSFGEYQDWTRSQSIQANHTLFTRTHSVFSRLYEFYLQDDIFFAVSHQLLAPSGGISIFKTLLGIPIRKNAGEISPSETKVDERFQKGNWRVVTPEMQAWVLNFFLYVCIPSRNQTWQWKINHLKMYLLLKTVIFH